jgi:hypothetical protein
MGFFSSLKDIFSTVGDIAGGVSKGVGAIEGIRGLAGIPGVDQFSVPPEGYGGAIGRARREFFDEAFPGTNPWGS